MATCGGERMNNEPKGLISRADEEAMEYEFQKQKRKKR